MSFEDRLHAQMHAAKESLPGDGLDWGDTWDRARRSRRRYIATVAFTTAVLVAATIGSVQALTSESGPDQGLAPAGPGTTVSPEPRETASPEPDTTVSPEPRETASPEPEATSPPSGETPPSGSVETPPPPILVSEPSPGDRFASGDAVAGTADVFEATVSIRLLDEDGDELVETFATATCGSGCRGDYSKRIRFQIDREQPGTLVLFEVSAEDGSETNKVTIPVVLVP